MPVIDHTPGFYEPAQASSWTYRPEMLPLRAEAELWRRRFAIAPAAEDRLRIELLLIDVQKDFCLPEGSLFVAGRSKVGAVEDTRRIAGFIYRNLHRLTRITPTMDSHFGMQIFFDAFWVDGSGARPVPFTMISADDVRSGRWQVDPAAAHLVPGGDGRPDYDWAVHQARHYVETLERAGKYSLTVWPYHCLLGDEGHALVGVLQAARMFHSAVRRVQSVVEIKGSNPWTENYSVFGAEVRDRWDGQGVLAEKNHNLIGRLVRNDAVVVAGQAASHCVMWSLDDLVTEIAALDPDLLRKVFILRDCCSPVVVFGADGAPVVDFTDLTEAAFTRWAGLGVNLVGAGDDIADWPGLQPLARNQP
ncbi:MAG: nicotinamidase [Azospirillum sp.]|nr:nicotinamidase [Azospirillum sp.]